MLERREEKRREEKRREEKRREKREEKREEEKRRTITVIGVLIFTLRRALAACERFARDMTSSRFVDGFTLPSLW